MYIPEGRTAIPEIGAKWAPIGASNDPGGLNDNWTAGVGAYYAALGGDPAPADPAAGPGRVAGVLRHGAPPPRRRDDRARPRPGAGRPAGGRGLGRGRPALTGDSPAGGSDPATGAPAVVDGFVFPLALARSATATYRDAFAEPGHGRVRRRAPPVRPHRSRARPATPPWRWPPAPSTAGDAADREEGIAFWITTPGGDRLGYGPLASYAPGIGEGVAVAAGQQLGTSAGWVRIAWERGEQRVNPFPLLQATRPSA